MSEARGTTGSTRREFLRTGGMLAAGMSVAPLLSACATIAPGQGINVEEISIALVDTHVGGRVLVHAKEAIATLPDHDEDQAADGR